MHTWINNTKRIMAEKKLKQVDLVPVMGVSTRGAIGHYLSGRSKPTIDQIEDLAKFLGVSFAFLVSDSGYAGIDEKTLKFCFQLKDDAQEFTSEKLTPNQASKFIIYLYRSIKEGKDVDLEFATDIYKLMN